MERKRARQYGIRLGRLEAGAGNAITDVEGVRVGHRTIRREGDADGSGVVRTGVTTVFPGPGLPSEHPVYVGVHILNGYGELIGINQLDEWGVLRTPVVLTSSLAIGKAYDGAARWIVGLDPAAAADDADMPVVTECDDSFLSDVRAFPLTDEDVAAALDAAVAGPVPEGCVGAGTGMQCFDFKGGIGTASRVVRAEMGGYAVGALVLTNYGYREQLLIDGVAVGEQISDLMPEEHSEGSCVVILATDAPMLPHQLRRMAQRAGLGLARTGSFANNSSGEQMLAFSTTVPVPGIADQGEFGLRALIDGPTVRTDSRFTALFEAAVEATEEAVLNAMFMAETTDGRDGNVLYELPIDRTLEILAAHGRPVIA